MTQVEPGTQFVRWRYCAALTDERGLPPLRMSACLGLVAALVVTLPNAGRATEADNVLLGKHKAPPGSPVLIRIFKQESELELWIENNGRFELSATYPICKWSGDLGPKQREGDKQAPEGLYSVGLAQLHYNGRLPRSFDIGFPNSFDQFNGRTGSAIFVHGKCQSAGCFAMTDDVMREVFRVSERALRNGQHRFQVHIFPFRMTDANLIAHEGSKWHGFWLDLKKAHDLFEDTRIPPKVGVCGNRYVVDEGVLGPRNKDLPVVAAPDTPFMLCEGIGAEPLPVLTEGDIVSGRMMAASNSPRAADRQHRSAKRAARSVLRVKQRRVAED